MVKRMAVIMVGFSFLWVVGNYRARPAVERTGTASGLPVGGDDVPGLVLDEVQFGITQTVVRASDGRRTDGQKCRGDGGPIGSAACIVRGHGAVMAGHGGDDGGPVIVSQSGFGEVSHGEPFGLMDCEMLAG